MAAEKVAAEKLAAEKPAAAKPATRKAANGRDPAATRERILRAALREFAQRGYAGGRVEGIAKRSGVAKGLVFHYFGTKEGLYLAVQQRIYENLRRRQDETQLAGLGPVEGMRKLVIDTFRGFREMPEIIRLMNEENLHQARNIRGAHAIPALYNPLVAAIERLIAAGREEGLFRAEIDPVAFYIALSGLGYFYMSNRYTLGTVLQVDLEDAGRIAAYEEMIADMVVAYLQGGAATLPMLSLPEPAVVCDGG
ncbi:TetR/AcrR family transcriptional regulator [Allostella humosa]|uniref:TetR/AcrR family transcriptional regulator n=1 Tax=Stella humosa TaxID=94 RepID=UPI0014769613|nr:TetR/AcrR family transcriptional regulator [Stella humosa]